MEVFNRKTDEYEVFEQTFLGACFGIGLKRKNDKNIAVYLLGEDDGHWGVEQEGCMDINWLSDLKQQIEAAEQWLKNNCFKTACGYEFKD
jgi:hypothetical protein